MKIEDVSLAALKYFVDAVELQSLTASAERNHVTRPAVSQAILKLEDWAQKKLLVHNRRLFELTDDGVKFFKVARRALQRMESDFSSLDVNERGLKIGVSSSVLDFLLPRLKPYLRSPELVSLKVAPTNQLIQFMQEKTIHLAITVDNERPTEFTTKTIHTGKFVVRSKDGQLGERLILTEERPETTALLLALRKAKTPRPSKIEVDSWRASQRLAASGIGSCLVPDFIEPENLKSVSVPGMKSKYRIVLLARDRHELSDQESELLNRF